MAPPAGPSLDQLHLFLRFAELGQLNRVAAELDLDLGHASRKLGQLRTPHGLIQGKGPTLALSPRGREALPAVRALLRQHAHLAAWLAGAADAPQALVAAAGQVAGHAYFPAAEGRFRRRLPDWTLQVQTCRGRERILGVAEGRYDLALVSHDRAQVRALAAEAGPAPVAIEDLPAIPVVAAARRGTAWAARLDRALESQAVAPAVLADLDLIGPDGQSGLRPQFEAVLGPVFRSTAAGWQAAREKARDRQGTALVPLTVLTPEDAADLVIRRVAELSVRHRLVYRPEANAGREALAQALQEVVAEQVEKTLRQWQDRLPV